MPTTTRERIGQAADRAGFAVTARGIFDELTRGDVVIVIMYSQNGAVIRAHLYRGDKVIPAESIASNQSGKAAIVLDWMDPR